MSPTESRACLPTPSLGPRGAIGAPHRLEDRAVQASLLDPVAGRAVLFAHCAFVLLLIVNAVRVFRHALYDDEVQAWLIARVSATPVALFHNLRYEGHPGLWHLLLWVITRFTADLTAMQALQLAIGAATWYLVYRCSPFSLAEKFLLLFSYFLFWEYFVMSRSYGLMALLGFGFVALRARWPERVVLPWLLLGLLANTVVFGAIWSMALAMFLGLAQILPTRSLSRGTACGGAIYLACLALAIATMAPAPDGNFKTPIAQLDPARLAVVVDHFVSRAFVPISAELLRHPATAFSGAWRDFWNPGLDLITGLPGIIVVWMALIVAARAAGSVMNRDRTLAVIEPIGAVIVTFIGALIFSYVWQIGNSRHSGVLFLAVVGAAWLLRARQNGRAPRWWITLLVVNALGGLITLQSELRPFSEARATAQWLAQNGLDRAFLMAADDPQVSIAGYLDRPIYDLGCQCSRRFIEWTAQRQADLTPATIEQRIIRALDRSSDAGDNILILTTPFAPSAAAPFTAPLLQAFTGAALDHETFYVYRVTGDSDPARVSGAVGANSRPATGQ